MSLSRRGRCRGDLQVVHGVPGLSGADVGFGCMASEFKTTDSEGSYVSKDIFMTLVVSELSFLVSETPPVRVSSVFPSLWSPKLPQ